MTGLRSHVTSLLAGNTRLLVRYVLVSVLRTIFAMVGIFLIHELLGGILGDEPGPSADLAASLGKRSALWVFAGVLVLTYVASGFCKFDSVVVEQRIMRRVELRVMERLVRHLLSQSIGYFEKQERGDLIQAIRQDVAQLRVVLVAILSLFLEGVLVLGLLVSAFLLSPMTLVVVVTLFLAAWPVFRFARKTQIQSRKVRKSGHVLYDIILQFLDGIRIIKIYRGEKEEARRAVARTREHFEEVVGLVRIESLATVTMEMFAGFNIVFVIIVGGVQVLDGLLGWPALLAFVVAMTMLHRPLNRVGSRLIQIQRHRAAVERVQELLDEQSRLPEGDVPFPGEAMILAVRDVGFKRGDETVLEGVTFEVHPGETLGIVGASGAGKTTLLNLVARFFDPTSGQICFGDVDLRRFRLEDYYNNLAIVIQEPFLFEATVRENILCGRQGVTQVEIENAARDAGIHGEILALPGGYDTIIGAGARGLSTGQAQRLNIARAVLRAAPILLLDEATASLDSVAEAQVQTALERVMRDRTTLIVAHRLSTLRNADRILVLDAGRSVGLGPHEDLLESCSTYAEMWSRQVGGHPEPIVQRRPWESHR